MYPNIQYSYVCYADSLEIERKQDVIYDLLKRGIKVILFTNKEMNFNEYSSLEIYKQVKLLQVNLSEQSFIGEMVEVIDGGDRESVTRFAQYFPRFNIEQYMIEHAPLAENIMVKAGAGTGKTTVMIDRILFLLLKEKVNPAEIVMITFTNEAATNMYKKLRELLFTRYSLTKSKKLLDAI